jgi:hypothetical protein
MSQGLLYNIVQHGVKREFSVETDTPKDDDLSFRWWTLESRRHAHGHFQPTYQIQPRDDRAVCKMGDCLHPHLCFWHDCTHVCRGDPHTAVIKQLDPLCSPMVAKIATDHQFVL